MMVPSPTATVVGEPVGPVEDEPLALVARPRRCRAATLTTACTPASVDLELERRGSRRCSWRTGTPSTVPAARSTTHVAVELDQGRRRRGRRAGSRRPGTGWPVSDAASIAEHPGRHDRAAGRRRAPGPRGRSSQAVSMVASRNSSPATSARRKPAFVVSPRIAVSSRAATSARRAVSRSGPWAMTLPSIGSYAVLTTWPLSSAWSTRAVRRPAHQGRRAGLGQEAAEGVLGVDPGLDRVAVERAGRPG